MKTQINSVLALCAAFFFALVAEGDEVVQRRLSITSQPSGATVFVDGKVRGQTPLMLFNLEPKVHHIRYNLKGYEDADELVDMAGGTIVSSSVILREERGLLLIKTDPAGCQIRVDGAVVGESPRFIGNLTSKDTHTIKLSKTGYRDQMLTVRFKGREPIVREEKMVLDSGVVNIVTDPAGAEVMVNGIVRGYSPVLVKEIPKGTTTVRLKLDGYKDEVRELKMGAGEQQTMSVSLTALPGTLHITSLPVNATVYVNEENRGKTPLSIPRLPSGDYEVRCEAQGYASISKKITISNGKSVREDFKLTNVSGRIEVKTAPVGAEVWLDGRRIGNTKAISGEFADTSDTFILDGILEGEHTVMFRKDGYYEATRTITVKAKGTARIPTVRMRKAFVPDVEITTADGKFRGVYKVQTPSSIIIETSPGVEYPIPRDFIRKIDYLIGK